MEERRKYVRIPENSQINYKVIPAERSGEHITKDISQGGIKFLVHNFIPKDSHLKIKLTLCGTHITIEALVTLVWIRSLPYSSDYEIGVKFVDIPPKAAEHLISYIRSFISAKE